MAGEAEIVSRLGKDLVQSLTEAVDFARGKPVAATVHAVEVPDVRLLRRRLHMSQQRFAEAYRIPLPTLKNWEQGRRIPDAPAAAYLLAIERQPDIIRDALKPTVG
jgi:putative transcriptional regulator